MTAQERFDSVYIAASDIMRELGISRTAMAWARRSGKLKDPIVVFNGMGVMYERAQVSAVVAEWKKAIEARRNVG